MSKANKTYSLHGPVPVLPQAPVEYIEECLLQFFDVAANDTQETTYTKQCHSCQDP